MEQWGVIVELGGVSADEADAMYDGHDESIIMSGPSGPDGRVLIEEFYCRANDHEEAVEIATVFVRIHAPTAEILSVVPLTITTLEFWWSDRS